MLFVIIALLGIIAGVSVGINLTFFRKLKEVVLDNEGLRKSLYNADNTIGKLRIGNNKLSEILRKRDSTIADMTAMFETSMDLPEEGKFEDWRNRLLNRHRQPELILVPTMGHQQQDSMLMDHLVNNDRSKELKKIASPTFYKDFEISPADLNAEDSMFWAKQNPPLTENIKYTETDVKILENEMDAYIKWENEQDDFPDQKTPRIGTAVHELAEKLTGNPFLESPHIGKIPGVEPATTVMPALEPLSIEEKHE